MRSAASRRKWRPEHGHGRRHRVQFPVDLVRAPALGEQDHFLEGMAMGHRRGQDQVKDQILGQAPNDNGHAQASGPLSGSAIGPTAPIDKHIEDLKAMFVYAPDTRIQEHPVKVAQGEWTSVIGIMKGTFTKPMPIGN